MSVYFIRAGVSGPMKIGHADNPQRRMAALQTCHWQSLQLVRTLDGGVDLERALHRHYAALHIRGEWFAFCLTMLEIQPFDLSCSPTIPASMNRHQADFLRAIEMHLAQTRVSAAAFGRQVANDPRFVFDLRRGREPKWRTRERVREFIANHTDGRGQ